MEGRNERQALGGREVSGRGTCSPSTSYVQREGEPNQLKPVPAGSCSSLRTSCVRGGEPESDRENRTPEGRSMIEPLRQPLHLILAVACLVAPGRAQGRGRVPMRALAPRCSGRLGIPRRADRTIRGFSVFGVRRSPCAAIDENERSPSPARSVHAGLRLDADRAAPIPNGRPSAFRRRQRPVTAIAITRATEHSLCRDGRRRRHRTLDGGAAWNADLRRRGFAGDRSPGARSFQSHYPLRRHRVGRSQAGQLLRRRPISDRRRRHPRRS